MAPLRIPLVVAAASLLCGCELLLGGPGGEPDAGPPFAADAAVDAGSCTDECTADAAECRAGAQAVCVAGADGCRKLGSRACPAEMIDWVPVAGGSFSMGSATGNADEKPVHVVSVSALEVTRTEITVGQYLLCLQAGACTAPASGQNANWGASWARYPVNLVTWTQAAEFCGWAGARLPSEAEWESLAGGHRGYLYPWGAQAATCTRANLDDEQPGSGDGCGTARSAPVCSRPDGASPEGLCDLGGNVWEWTQDWYHPTYDGAPTDGGAWLANPSSGNRVMRGGGYLNPGAWERVSARFAANPAGGHDDVGFRCARAP